MSLKFSAMTKQPVVDPCPSSHRTSSLPSITSHSFAPVHRRIKLDDHACGTLAQGSGRDICGIAIIMMPRDLLALSAALCRSHLRVGDKTLPRMLLQPTWGTLPASRPIHMLTGRARACSTMHQAVFQPRQDGGAQSEHTERAETQTSHEYAEPGRVNPSEQFADHFYHDF